MTLDLREIGDVTIIDIDGRVTVEEGADIFREGIQQVIGRGRVQLVLNFQGVSYIDSTAMGEIIRAYMSATRRGGAMKLLKVPARIHEQLRTTRLLSVFDLFEAEAEALNSFGVVPTREH